MIKLTLPELKYPSESFNGNIVVHFGDVKKIVNVEVIEENSKCIVVMTSAGMIIKLFKPRVQDEECEYGLRISGNYNNLNDLNEGTKLKWLSHPSLEWPDDADKLIPLWKNKVHLKGDSDGDLGFREPQLGALHAISAHWSVNSDPAIIVMPTGTGKTETMMATCIFHKCKKVLVIVPTDPLRTQIFNKFASLGCLREIGCLDFDTPNPRVCRVKTGIKSRKDARDLLASSNVLIATAAVLSNSGDEAKAELAKGVTHVFVDEAHHIPAPTWERVKDYFVSSKVLHFTATPFRNDRKKIKGKIIYNYPLGKAQDSEYFKEIELLTVDEMDDAKSDRAIAEKAIEKLRIDLENDLDHLILARTKTIKRAEKVLQVYSEIASDLSPVAVYSSGMSKTEQREKIEKLKNRESRILICVDMFGEGFDFPNLKIAAMHDIHKTLPITLQFIGRFTRVSSKVGNASVVINLDDPKTASEIQGLYSQDANWNNIVRRASEDRIAEEIDMQEFINSFKGALPEHLPLWNMKPGFSTLIFRNSSLSWNPLLVNDAFPDSMDVWSANSESADVVVTVTAKKEDVKWGKYENIKNHIWNLIILHLDRDLGLLFVHQSDYKVVNPISLAKKVCGEDISLLSGPMLFRVFSCIERPMIKNLGATKSGTISFTMYFGPEVSAGLSQVEKAQSELNNLLGWGYEDGKRVVVGSSHRRGKVWSVTGGSIKKWMSWCSEVGRKVLNEQLPDAEVIQGFLRPISKEVRPDKIPISVEWGEYILRELEDRIIIFFGDIPRKVHQVDIYTDQYDIAKDLTFKIKSEGMLSEYKLEIFESEKDPKYRYSKISGPTIYVKKGSGQTTKLEDWLVRDPVLFMYLDGSFSYNNYLVEAPCVGEIDESLLKTLDWSGVNIRKESQGKERDSESIQYRYIDIMNNEDFDVIFNDDDSGEAADIIAFRKDTDDIVTLTFVHCKFSKEDEPGARVDDLYAVCGQAQKSIKWKHRSLKDLIEHMKKRQLRWLDLGYSRFIKGDLSRVRYLERFARKKGLRLKVIIVQPGLSKAKISSDIKRLLGTTEQYLKMTSEAEFEIICSE